jgi:hypothetical protein
MMLLPPPCFTIGMVPGFLQKWRLAFRPKSSILVSNQSLFVTCAEYNRCRLYSEMLTYKP